MKKTTKTLIGLLSLLVFNQTINAANPISNSGKLNPGKKLTTRHSGVKPAAASSATPANQTRWYNYGETMDAFFQGTSVANFNYLFPDSNITAQFGTDYSNPFVHMLGDVLDVKSEKFNDPITYPVADYLHLGATNKYKLDSLSFQFVYTRTDTSIVDSLIFEIGVNGSNTQLPTYYFTGQAADYGVDTTYFKGLKYTYQTHKLNFTSAGGATKKRYAVALNNQTIADTLDNGTSIVSFSTADLPIITAGKLVVSAVSFKPAYTYNLVDTLNQKNHVTFISLEEQDGAFPIYTDNDYNQSYIINSGVRYNIDANWNGLFLPTLAYTAPYSFEHHSISYKISSLCTDSFNLQVTTTPEDSLASGTATAVAAGGTAPYTYSWTPGNISGPSATGLTAGGYTVTVTDANGCQLVQSAIITGINEVNEDKISINLLPNPANSRVTLEYFSEKNTSANLRVVSINGQEVYNENINIGKGSNVHSMDISTFSKGVYFVQLVNNNTTITKKLVKN